MPNFFLKGRDPMSSFTHFIGAIGAILGTILLAVVCLIQTPINFTKLFSCIVFGGSMIALYVASSHYHYVNTDATRLLRLRKLDHAMIYVLIAGTYTPIALCFMGKMHGIIFTIVIWAIALLGIVTKLLWFNAPRWLYTSLYLLMGWAIIFDIKVFNGMAAGCIALIAAGGISYSIGAICYICKKPNIGKWFGFHEIFHLFIMLGTLLHFCAVIFYIV